MSNRKRILIWVGGVLAVLIVYLCLYGPQTAWALIAWNWGRKVPAVKITPLELKDSSINDAHGTKLTYFGYSFDIPWADIDEAKSKAGTNAQLLGFRSGMFIFIGRSHAREFVSDIAKESGGEEILKRNYGADAVSSDYSFQREMLNVTPHSVDPFGSREAAARKALLVLTKVTSVTSPAETGIFSLRTSHFQGFQFGNPTVKPDIVYIHLFDDSGSLGITVECHAQCAAYPITQGDINRISQSLVKVSSEVTPGDRKVQASR
jgi:hypothetical protein